MDPTAARAVLERARDELRSELETLTAAPRDPMGAVSFGKRVAEGTSQAVERIAQVDAAQRLDAKLRDVERALDKLDDGTYGTCDVCGRPIGDLRLEAIPWAVLCLDEARSRLTFNPRTRRPCRSAHSRTRPQ